MSLLNKGKISRLRHNWINANSILKHISKFSTQINKGCLLDIGCGRMPYRQFFRKTDFYIGIDLPLEKSATKSIKHADLFADALYLPFQEKTFDGVLATEVLEHVPDGKKLFAEISRILKPGGKLLVTVPMVIRLHEEPHDDILNSLLGLRYLCAENNLNVLNIEATSGFWETIGQEINRHFWEHLNRKRNIFLSAIIIPVCLIIQFLAYFLDRLDHDPKLPLGWCLLAEKPG